MGRGVDGDERDAVARDSSMGREPCHVDSCIDLLDAGMIIFVPAAVKSVLPLIPKNTFL